MRSQNKWSSNDDQPRKPMLFVQWDKEVKWAIMDEVDIISEPELSPVLIERINSATNRSRKIAHYFKSEDITLLQEAQRDQVQVVSVFKKGEDGSSKMIGNVYYCITNEDRPNLFQTCVFWDYLNKTNPTFAKMLRKERIVISNVGLIIYRMIDQKIEVFCSIDKEPRKGIEMSLFGGSCNYAIDTSSTQVAARELLEETMDGTYESDTKEQQLTEIISNNMTDIHTPYVIHKCVEIFVVPYTDSFEKVLPLFARDLVNNKEKTKIFWKPINELDFDKFDGNIKEALKAFSRRMTAEIISKMTDKLSIGNTSDNTGEKINIKEAFNEPHQPSQDKQDKERGQEWNAGNEDNWCNAKKKREAPAEPNGFKRSNNRFGRNHNNNNYNGFRQNTNRNPNNRLGQNNANNNSNNNWHNTNKESKNKPDSEKK